MRLFCTLTGLLLAMSVTAQPTARQWNSEVIAGWNLGNQLESPTSETSWGNPVVTPQTLQAVQAAGFNAVRIPVRWEDHVTNTSTMTVDAKWMARVKEVVGYALDCGMKVIVNTHHEQWLEGRPTYTYKEENTRRLQLLWTQIADAFKDYGYDVAFAGTNEVHVPDNWDTPTSENLDVQNAYNQTFVDAVRATGGNNQKRHLIVQTYNCDLNFGLGGRFVVPTDIAGNDNNYMSVEVHHYSPWEYCGSNTYYYWGQNYSRYGSIPKYNEQSLRTDFLRMAQTWDEQGLGLVIGEWGITDHWTTESNKTLIHENMTYYCRLFVSEARQRGISTFVWDNGVFGNGAEKFGIFDRHNGMNLVADWILKGIQQGVATGVSSIENGQLRIENYDYYNLAGQRVGKDYKGIVIKNGRKYIIPL